MTRRLAGLGIALLAVVMTALAVLGPGGFLPRSQDLRESAQAAPLAAVPAAVTGLGSFTVTARHLGITSRTKPDAPLQSIRLDCWPGWRQSNPSRGVYDWTIIDKMVSDARAWGYRDLMLPFCGTPLWAAGAISKPAREVLGYKTTAPPKYMADWQAFVTAVVKRYKGRITSYQVWNEATTDQFFQGTPKQMAQMTQVLFKVVGQHDPGATVVSASMQQFNPAVRDWGLRYLKQLKALGWPVEVYSFHGYGPDNTFANGRQSVITGFRKQLSSLRAPSRPVWDTEVTYKSAKALSGQRQGALVLRSFMDGWRMGIPRTYWYRWSEQFNSFGAVQMRPGSVPAKALKRFSTQVIGASYRGCTEGTNGLVRCRFLKNGKYFTILWAEGSAVTVTRSTSTRFVNLVTGTSASSRRIQVTGSPLLINARV